MSATVRPFPVSETSPVLAALCSAQGKEDGCPMSAQLAAAMPLAERVIRDGVFDAGVLRRAVEAFGAGDKTFPPNQAVLSRLIEQADNSGDTDTYNALVLVPDDVMVFGYLIGLAAGLSIGGGAR